MCLQECLKLKKPVSGAQGSTLAPGVPAVELSQIESTEASCLGCCKNSFLSQIQVHGATCLKSQNYITEGVKVITKDVTLRPKNVPSRYIFPCPCYLENFDRGGLVEHCQLIHSMDTKSVVYPMCASIPWGERSSHSTDFIAPTQFSYGTLVNYDVDEGRDEPGMAAPSTIYEWALLSACAPELPLHSKREACDSST